MGDRLATDWVSGMAYVFAHWRQLCVAHWQDGLVYMVCVMGILLTHEMGHFLVTLRYRVPASFPYFVPLPISPIGTMGAVIFMDSNRANRREMFDIGLAGPLAGLLVAVPVMCVGIAQLDLRPMPMVRSPSTCRCLPGWRCSTFSHPDSNRGNWSGTAS